MIRRMRASRAAALILAVVFGSAPFAFVLCGVNCRHAAAAAIEGHACHEADTPADTSTATMRGVPPACTHLEAESTSVFSRIGALFTMTGLVGQVEGWVEPSSCIASPAASVAIHLNSPAGLTATRQLRI